MRYFIPCLFVFAKTKELRATIMITASTSQGLKIAITEIRPAKVSSLPNKPTESSKITANP